MLRRSLAGWRLVVLMAALAALAASAVPVGAQENPRPRPETFTLTLLHSNDGESQLINAGTGLEDFGGVARFATVADQLKQEALSGRRNRGVVMLSAGDNFLAGPEFQASLDKGVPYYDAVALDLIGFDAMTIGNHEFDFGPDVLADFIESFGADAPPFISANLDVSAEPRLDALADQGTIVHSTVVVERGRRIGIVAATTPDLPFISSPRDVVVDPDLVTTVQAEINRLTRRGVKIIVFAPHLQGLDADFALAPLLRGVDLWVAGGGDEVLANGDDLLVPDDVAFGPYPLYVEDALGRSVPLVTGQGDYRYVGRLVATFSQSGRVISVDEVSGPVRVAGGSNPDAVAPDPEVQTVVVDPVAEFVAELDQTVIGTSEVDLDGQRSPGIRSQETNLGNLVADSLKWQAEQLADEFGTPLPDVALQNGGGIRNNNVIPAGPISELDTFSILPFPNFLAVLPSVEREQFKLVLENAVSQVPADGSPGADGRFAQISGFSFVYDPALPPMTFDDEGNIIDPGSRVVSATLDDGTPIVEDGHVVAGDPLVVSTIDFLARGGDFYPLAGEDFVILGASYQQALSNYIQEGLGGLISAAEYPEGGEGRISTP
jgi:2',3'-cyclic-nucleotide 2'-phosphodiesterase (5'-nucleotidase family)